MSDTPQTSRTERPRVLVFFDYSCPFCYLDWPRFAKLRIEHGVELVLCPFELRPGLPAEGVGIEQIGAHSERVVEHMARMAEAGGLCFEDQKLVANSHRALALGEFARDVGPERHEAVHLAIFQAYYCDGADIGDLDVVLHVAEASGLDADAARQAIEAGAYDERLHEFRHLALALGVQATPSALVCNELFIGSRPYEVLASALRDCVERPHVHEGGMVEERVDREEEGEPATVRGS